MDLATTLPRILASLNAVNIVLLAAAYRAIRRGERDRHRTLMLVNLGIAVLFIVVYVTQTTLSVTSGSRGTTGFGPSF